MNRKTNVYKKPTTTMPKTKQIMFVIVCFYTVAGIKQFQFHSVVSYLSSMGT